jgi:DNA-binding MarR family transcriptional regulator
MSGKREIIAELVTLLPMFIKTLLEGSDFHTAAELNISEKKTLIYIFKHGSGTMSECSKRVGLARGSFTAVADSLEEKGLVNRISGSDDRRKCILMLTKEGEKVAREINARFKQQVAARLARLSEEELGNLKKALETIAATAEKLSDRRYQ